MTAPKMKPCPFCGGTKIDGGYNDHGGFVSICANCDTFGPPAAEMSKDAILAAWNTRADAPELVALVAALRNLHGAVCGETGFAAAVRAESGKAYPWPWLDQADADAVSALAAYEALQ